MENMSFLVIDALLPYASDGAIYNFKSSKFLWQNPQDRGNPSSVSRLVFESTLVQPHRADSMCICNSYRPLTNTHSKARTLISHYCEWDLAVATQHCLLSYRDLKSTQQHYRGKLKRAQIYILWRNVRDNQVRTNRFNAEMEAPYCLLLWGSLWVFTLFY